MHQLEHDEWYHVEVLANTVFLPRVREWLEQRVGAHQQEWVWSYHWRTFDVVDGEDLQQCQLTVAFVDARWSSLFALAWSEVCV